MPLIIKASFVVISTETLIHVYLDRSRWHHLNHIFIGVIGGEWACTRSLREEKSNRKIGHWLGQCGSMLGH